MKRLGIFIIAILALTVLFLSSSSVLAQKELENTIPGQFIIVFHDDVDDPQKEAEDIEIKHGLVVEHTYKKGLKGCSAQIPTHKLEELEADPRVKFIEPDRLVYAVAAKAARKTPSPQPPQVLPTGVNRIDGDLNSVANIDGFDVRVNVDIAIIDTGVSKGHPDLNFFTGVTIGGAGRAGGDDDNGHGSHVAGIVAAIDNGVGVVGMAPGARLWSVKVLNATGSGSLSGVLAGIDWVTQRASQIDVANMSLGLMGKSDALRAAIQKSVAAGIVYVVAAGNNGKDVYGDDGIFNTADDFVPAAYPEVAAVSAIADSDGKAGGEGASTSYGSDDTFASYSNYSRSVVPDKPVSSPGGAIDLAAPGVNILSTWKGSGYNTISGTSMAAPHVAGLAALYIASHGKPVDAAEVTAVRQALVDAATPQDVPNGYQDYPDQLHAPLAYAGTF